ncbi:MAG: hypothetical protein GC189_03675 [Alphaproteobacteria bacterium]|nr:hypothetical protein [Alphaproteobacteria bacterium]
MKSLLISFAAAAAAACGAQNDPSMNEVEPAPLQTQEADSTASPAATTGEIIIRLEDAHLQALIAADADTRPAEAQAALARTAPAAAGLEIARVTAGGDLVLRGDASPARVAAIEADPAVSFAQPDRMAQPQTGQ